MKTEFLSTSPDSTFALGEKIGACLRGREILFLFGDLGAGKTLLTKGIASALGIDSEEVVSPTFTLMNRFDGRFPLYHIDLYRLGEDIDGTLPEIDDYLGEGIIIIEWAQFLGESYRGLPNSIDIQFHLTPEDNRKVEIKTQLDYLESPAG